MPSKAPIASQLMKAGKASQAQGGLSPTNTRGPPSRRRQRAAADSQLVDGAAGREVGLQRDALETGPLHV
jgi:hypothetical protein